MIGLIFAPLIIVCAFLDDSPAGATGASIAQEASLDNVIVRLKKDLGRDDSLSAQRTDDSLAVAAQWDRLKNSVNSGRIGGKADFFLGFINGRCQAVAPEWWSDVLRNGKVSPDRWSWFPCRQIARRWKGDNSGWKFSGFDAASSHDDELTLQLGKQRAILKKRDFPDLTVSGPNWNQNQDGAVAGAIRENICAVALECPTEFQGPKVIYCLNVETGKVMWKQDIIAGCVPNFGIGGGVEGSFTEVTVDEERVIVWIGHDFSMCFEVFRKQDGKRIATFATGYLDEIRIRVNDDRKAPAR